MDLTLIYRALADGQVDVIAGDATAGLIEALDLAMLEDDRQYFPPYDAVPGRARGDAAAPSRDRRRARAGSAGRVTARDDAAHELRRRRASARTRPRSSARFSTRSTGSMIDELVTSTVDVRLYDRLRTDRTDRRSEDPMSRHARHAYTEQFRNAHRDPHRRQPVQIYSLPALEKAGFPGVVAAAVLDEDPAREPAAPRGQRLRQGRRHPRARASGTPTAGVEKEISFMPARVLLQDFTGVPCVVDLAAMRDAIVALGGDPGSRQPAAAGRARHRPLGAGRLLRPRRRVRAQRRARVLAQPRALRVPALGPARVQQLPGRAARHRHRPPGQHRVPRARGVLARRSTARRSRIPTRSSAPTRTRRWSTDSASSAGASAASRPRRRCSASRSRC